MLWEQKKEKLVNHLEELAAGDVCLAVSGGVDSSLLLYLAARAAADRGSKLYALTFDTNLHPRTDMEAARRTAAEAGVPLRVIPVDELAELPQIRRNPPDRCYLCKRALFENIQRIASKNGFSCVVEGSNLDDNQDYRPGHRAIAELGIKSPLRDAGLTKAEIRQLSHELGLPTWDKPSYACLASRFVYGEAITPEKLSMVEQAEQYLMDQGFRQMRVRVHGNLARVEVLPEDIPRLLSDELRRSVSDRLKGLGFSYVTLDLAGFRSGSMNEVLKEPIL